MTETQLADYIEQTRRIVTATIRRHLPYDAVDDIDDIMQEVYLKFYTQFSSQMPSYESAGKWLYVVARNRCYSLLRKKTREANAIEKFKQDQPLHINGDNGFVQSDEVQMISLELKLKKAVSILSKNHAEILDLYLQGNSERTIAERLCIKPGTVKSRLSRAKESLARVLGSDFLLDLKSNTLNKEGTL